MQTTQKSYTPIPILDWMRGIAALFVCSGHLRNVLMVDWSIANNHGTTQKMLYAITGLGHQSVVVFFVLSGYLIGGSVLSSGARFMWTDYLVARLSRLWTVVIPCIAITFIADFFSVGLADGLMPGSAPDAAHYSISLTTLLGNLAFLQTIFVPVFGSNSPMWSLASEFWYYMLFPMGMHIWRRWRHFDFSLIANVFIATIILASLPWEIRIGFSVWLMGTLVSWLNQKFDVVLTWRSVLLGACCVVGAVVFSKTTTSMAWPVAVCDLVLGLAVAGFLFSVLKAHVFTTKIWVASRLSDLSFSLYLSHFPFVVLIAIHLIGKERLQPSVSTWLIFSGLQIALLFVAWSVWWLFERRTHNVKIYMGRFVHGILTRK